MGKQSGSSYAAKVQAHARATGQTHVTSTHQANSAGFSRAHLGRDTAPGSAKGAPLSSGKVHDDKVRQTQHPAPHGGNPYNPHDQNERGVLGPSVKAQHAPGLDAPVPTHAERPDTGNRSKAANVGQEAREYGDQPHPRGVLGREDK